jgi:predicted Zn-dependent protease
MPLARLIAPVIAAALAFLPLAPSAAAQGGDDQLLAKIAAEFGGRYDDAQVGTYVTSIGQVIVATTPMAREPFTFTVLNSDIVNAFSLPGGAGGHVFITRGLLALANNEAELAGVLGHEVGHVTAGHSKQRQHQDMMTQLGAAGAGLLGALLGSPEFGNIASQVVGTGGELYLKKYSRDQEFEADQLGVNFMSRAGYDPQAMVSFLSSLEAQSALDGRIHGQVAGDKAYSMMADHPRTYDRVQRAMAEARTSLPRDPMTKHEPYLRKIDGLLYGDDPQQGIIRGRVFEHPGLAIRFEAPPGFQLGNSETQVQARGPNGALIVFDQAPRAFTGDPAAYLRSWAPNLVTQTERIDVNGMAAATAAARAQLKSVGDVDLRLVAIRADGDRYYRFIFVSPPAATAQLAAGFQRTAYSFRRLNPGEAAQIRPLRVRIVRVSPADTVDSLSARLPFTELKRERFLVLNNLPADTVLRPGDVLKVIGE